MKYPTQFATITGEKPLLASRVCRYYQPIKFTVNLSSITVGIAIAWSSNIVSALLDEKVDLSKNPLGRPVTVWEGSLIASIMTVGAFLGIIAITLWITIESRNIQILIRFRSFSCRISGEEVWSQDGHTDRLCNIHTFVCVTGHHYNGLSNICGAYLSGKPWSRIWVKFVLSR